jgi:hypothetical protein
MMDAKEPESVRALRRIREMNADVDAWVEWGEDGQRLEAYPGELLDHITTLTRKLNALTMHMNQVHATLGGTDTVLTLEAAQHVVFERDEAVQDASRWRFFCCPQTALMLGSNCDPNDNSIDWRAEINRLADERIAALTLIDS